MDSLSKLSRRESCIGWRCLTSSQQFGVIFSIVVFFLFFSVIFMFYLGRAKISHESKKSCKSKLRSAAVANQPTSPSMLFARPPPMAPCNPCTTFLPCTFTVYGEPIPVYHPNPALTPRAAIWPHLPAIPASNFPIPANYAATPERQLYSHAPAGVIPSVLQSNFKNAQNQSQYAAQPAAIPVPATYTERPSPSWFQKLQRALKTPPGRASTVASRSPSVASRRLDAQAAVTQVEEPICAATSEDHGAQKPTEKPSNTNSSGFRDNLDTISVDTAAATVRSDDFEMPMSRGAIPSMTSVGSHGAQSSVNDPAKGIPDATVISQAISSSGDIVSKDEAPPRVSRESRRRAWETMQNDSEVDSASESSGYEPRAPKAVRQGGV